MQSRAHVMEVSSIMESFARKTGLLPSGRGPQRYLWTDAFAVCNFLELHRRTGEEKYLQLALRLVDQVHASLGRHRDDDPRTGWISGLTAPEGERHPTIGGLRIGKQLGERNRAQPCNDRLEWDRDGQYYHYLTKWMHALHQTCKSTGNPVFSVWACELAKAAHAAFVYSRGAGLPKRMHWKMSIDLSYPLVDSMGHHDPLDGLVTCLELDQLSVLLHPDTSQGDLVGEIADLAQMCRHTDWTTDDPLGLGGLMFDACRILQMGAHHERFNEHSLLLTLLEASRTGLEMLLARGALNAPAEARLAFRELGLTIGLHAVSMMSSMLDGDQAIAIGDPAICALERLTANVSLCETIEAFWLDPRNMGSQSWLAHENINTVMLATSLAPDGFLILDAELDTQPEESEAMATAGGIA